MSWKLETSLVPRAPSFRETERWETLGTLSDHSGDGAGKIFWNHSQQRQQSYWQFIIISVKIDFTNQLHKYTLLISLSLAKFARFADSLFFFASVVVVPVDQSRSKSIITKNCAIDFYRLSNLSTCNVLSISISISLLLIMLMLNMICSARTSLTWV